MYRALVNSGVGHLDAGDQSDIFHKDRHGEIVAIDIERDVDVLRVQIQTGRIMKAPDLAACEDEPTIASGSPGLPSSRFRRWIAHSSSSSVRFSPLSPIATSET